MIRAVDVTTEQPEVQSKIEPFLLEVADVVNTTLDLDTTLRRVAELVRKVVDYEIFAILLLNEKTQDLRIRFQVGYPKEVADRMRIKVGDGVTGLAAQRREAILVGDVAKDGRYISAIPEVRSELVSRLIDYQMFSILLLDASGEKLQHRFSLRFQENIQLKHDVPLGKGIVGHAAQHKHAVLVPDVSKDARYVLSNPETRSELAVPLIYKDKVIGVLDLEHTRRGFFTDDHKRTVTTLAAQVAIAIENARLYEQIERQEKRLERDLELARELQFRLLPQSLPKLPHLQLAAKFAPARAIGGDLYDFVSYSLSRTALVIGDVSGKGAPAAIYAALVSGILRSHAPMEPGPAEMQRAVNFSLGERRIEGQFVSMIYAVWDDEQQTLQVANSGLPRPLYWHDDKIEIIEATGLPLGLFDDADYDEFTFNAKPGDKFVFFSDGILDARNEAGDLFGRSRVEQIVANSDGVSAEGLVNSLFDAVAEHAAGVETFDDQTVVVIKVKDGSGSL